MIRNEATFSLEKEEKRGRGIVFSRGAGTYKRIKQNCNALVKTIATDGVRKIVESSMLDRNVASRLHALRRCLRLIDVFSIHSSMALLIAGELQRTVEDTVRCVRVQASRRDMCQVRWL